MCDTKQLKKELSILNSVTLAQFEKCTSLPSWASFIILTKNYNSY